MARKIPPGDSTEIFLSSPGLIWLAFRFCLFWDHGLTPRRSVNYVMQTTTTRPCVFSTLNKYRRKKSHPPLSKRRALTGNAGPTIPLVAEKTTGDMDMGSARWEAGGGGGGADLTTCIGL